MTHPAKPAPAPSAAGPADALTAVVGAVVRELLGAPAAGSAASAAAVQGTPRRSRVDEPLPRPGARPKARALMGQATTEAPAAAAMAPPTPASALPGLSRVVVPDRVAELVATTPSRIGVGRTGLRYPTDVYLTLRADHALAKDAVASRPDPAFVAKLGSVELQTDAKDLQTFLLEPEQGRRLDTASLNKLRGEGTRGADVQVILADGLSGWAAERNPGLLQALVQHLTAAGFTVGKPLFVHRARIAVQDQIGVELGAKATVIALGERPGLGTGDSMSLYIAWGPKIGQDNADKNCISNVRPAGFDVQRAAEQCAAILTRARELGQGGLAIQSPTRTW